MSDSTQTSAGKPSGPPDLEPEPAEKCFLSTEHLAKLVDQMRSFVDDVKSTTPTIICVRLNQGGSADMSTMTLTDFVEKELAAVEEMRGSGTSPAPSDPALKTRIEAALRAKSCDHEEMVFMALTVPEMNLNQIVVVAKPWLLDAQGRLPHKHCLCGIRTGVDPAHDQTHAEADTVKLLMTMVRQVYVCNLKDRMQVGVAFGYTQRIVAHTRKILKAEEGVPPGERVAILGAACLEGINGDFSRQTDKVDELVEFARDCIGKVVGHLAEEGEDPALAPELVENILEVLRHSKTRVPSTTVNPRHLFPRLAGCLESWGLHQAIRVVDECLAQGLPLRAETTPVISKPREAIDIATPERNAAWKEGGRKSASMVDFLYDMILQDADALLQHPNQYLKKTAKERVTPFIDLCFTKDEATAAQMVGVMRGQLETQ
jgi:hypothetical protein